MASRKQTDSYIIWVVEWAVYSGKLLGTGEGAIVGLDSRKFSLSLLHIWFRTQTFEGAFNPHPSRQRFDTSTTTAIHGCSPHPTNIWSPRPRTAVTAACASTTAVSQADAVWAGPNSSRLRGSVPEKDTGLADGPCRPLRARQGFANAVGAARTLSHRGPDKDTSSDQRIGAVKKTFFRTISVHVIEERQ